MSPLAVASRSGRARLHPGANHRSLAAATVPTEFQTVALEAICQNYLGAGLQFKDWKQALLYARKHAHDTNAPVVPIGSLTRFDRPPPTLTSYDDLLEAQ